MTDEKVIDLWGEAQKQTTISNPRAFEDLKVFAQLVEKEDKTPIEPEDVINAMYTMFRWFFGFLGVVLIVSLVYAMIHFPPAKPVPDCGSCRLYQGKTK